MDEPCNQLDRIKISWSQLQAHEMCKHRAMLQRRGGRSPITDIRNFFHGTVCDRIMRAWLESDDPAPGQMAPMVDEYIVRCLDEAKNKGEGVVRWKSAADRAEMTEFCRLVVSRLEPILFRLVIPYEYQAEMRFKVPIRIPYLDGTPAEVDLVGGIDILTRRSEKMWYPYDLKATANPDYVRKILGQGIFYDLVILAMFGSVPQEFGFIQPAVENNQVVSVKVSNEDRVSMLSRITQVAHDRWRGLDEPKPDSEGCSYCPVKFQCKKFSPQASVFTPKRGRGNTWNRAAS
jgi:phage gp16-like protein